MSAVDCPIVFLSQKGDIRQGKLKGATLDAALLAAFKSKKQVPSNLGKYAWKGKTLFLFGFLEGKDGTENQHHLPPPLEGMSFFGDILVLCSPSSSSYTAPTPFKTSDYEAFYTNRLEGEDEDEDEIEEELDAEVEVVEDVPVEEEAEEEEEEEIEYSDDESEEDEKEEEDAEDEIPLARPIPKALKPKKPSKKAQAAAIPAGTFLDGPELDASEGPESIASRQRVLEVLRGLFDDSLTEDQCLQFETLLYSTALDVATKEKTMKSWENPEFLEIYLAVSRRILGNLNPRSYVGNTHLWQRFQDGEITLEQICKQNYYELYPEQWQTMVDRQAKRERIQLEGDFSRATDRWQCNGCKMRKCTYYELQTRSADEPMTIFIHCLNCGKRWTQ